MILCHFLFLMLSTTSVIFFLFFFTDTPTTEIYTLSLHDALPIYRIALADHHAGHFLFHRQELLRFALFHALERDAGPFREDRKSTRLNSSHTVISYAVFCLKKKKNIRNPSSAVIR